MNGVALDWLDLTVILSTLAVCAMVGWFAAGLMGRSAVFEAREPVAPVVDVRRIEVTVVDRGWRRGIARTRADRDQAPSGQIRSLIHASKISK
jgi:hypothetical protein